MNRRVTGLLVLLGISTSPMRAEIRYVPQQYATIQAAINAAAHGDTVLVAPGVYYENIIFRGRNIVVASHYLTTGEQAFIRNTIINGSRPQQPDTASCVLIINREDTTAVLAGFTLTAGCGTRWRDEHGAGDYWEGGGLLVARSSPTIRNNLFIDNEAINGTRAVSAGGGAIRCGDGAPRIWNNLILGNRGMYGAGLVLNYCNGASVRNNIFAGNRVYQAEPGRSTFGGGGIWVNEVLSRNGPPNVIENNTVVGNAAFGEGGAAAGRGGALLTLGNANVEARNNICWGNTQRLGGPVSVQGGRLVLTYSTVTGGYSGTGNLALDPEFADSSFYLAAHSACRDAGDPSAKYEDPADPAHTATAAWPSLGGRRNDMGAYGGPQRSVFPKFSRPVLALGVSARDFGNILPGQSGTLIVPLTNLGASPLVLQQAVAEMDGGNTIEISGTFPRTLLPLQSDSLALRWSPVQDGLLQDTLLIFHNDTSTANPARVILTGNANPTPQTYVDTAPINMGELHVNTAHADTSFYVYNHGTGPDSLYLALDYRGLTPSHAIAVSPAKAFIAAGDSLLVTFTVYPPAVAPPFLALYSPRVVITARFSLGTTRFEKQIRFRLTGSVGVEEGESNVPAAFELAQNHPNPFNPRTAIRFSLPRLEHVTLTVYDALGREVAALLQERREAGRHQVHFDAHGLAGGVYHYTLRTSEFTRTRKMILLR